MFWEIPTFCGKCLIIRSFLVLCVLPARRSIEEENGLPLWPLDGLIETISEILTAALIAKAAVKIWRGERPIDRWLI